MSCKYLIRNAEPRDEKQILEIARNVTDKVTREYLGDKAVDWYINSGECDKDMKNDICNMLVLIYQQKIIGMMIWHNELLHFLMIDIPYHGTGAAKYFCENVIPKKLEEFKEIHVECFDKNERGNAFYEKMGWEEYDRITDEMTGGNRVLYKMTK